MPARHPLQFLKARRAAITLGLLLPLSFGGCSGGGGGKLPDLAPVTGKVTLDGQPLGNAVVSFVPQKGAASGGVTDAEGKYVLRYRDGTPGAALGQHQVLISTDLEGEMTAAAEKVPKKYNANSELTANVVAGGNEINFDLTK
jgi:hypothetical protein